MGNMFIGLTDYTWYKNLCAKQNLEEVNFWRPGKSPFRAINPNDMFLFKLKAPYHVIVGGGYFVRYALLPIQLAWDAFGEGNGDPTFYAFEERILTYKKKFGITENILTVGCILLSESFFFCEKDWIVPPKDWAGNIVVGKKYDMMEGEGHRIFKRVSELLSDHGVLKNTVSSEYVAEDSERYGLSLSRHRLGQGTFRVLVTESYRRRCAISGEKTLPVLEAAHIKPYSVGGQHLVSNGILLRSDIHRLFDDGYITVTPSFNIEVSRRLNEDYGNGRIYYRYHGQRLCIAPDSPYDQPSGNLLAWHNENIFLG